MSTLVPPLTSERGDLESASATTHSSCSRPRCTLVQNSNSQATMREIVNVQVGQCGNQVCTLSPTSAQQGAPRLAFVLASFAAFPAHPTARDGPRTVSCTMCSTPLHLPTRRKNNELTLFHFDPLLRSVPSSGEFSDLQKGSRRVLTDILSPYREVVSEEHGTPLQQAKHAARSAHPFGSI